MTSKLRRFKLGDLIEQRREKYDGKEALPIRGVTRDGFIPPKQKDADTSIYNVFHKNDFVFNPARMELNSIALNKEIEKGICSSLYEVFYVKRTDIIIPEYLNMFIKRSEFARKCWFNAVGSARNYFRVPDLGEFELDIPSLDIQKKYVDIYETLLSNLCQYETGLDDLKLVCDGFFDKLKKTEELKNLGDYITRVDIRNSDNKCKKVMGVSTSKEFREPTSKVNKNELSNYKICKPRQISFVQTTHNEKVFCNAMNRFNEDVVVTSVNEVFECDESRLLPEFLTMYFNRKEFDRYARFHSWGSAREVFTWDDLIRVKMPIPSIEVQRSIVSISNSLICRKDYLKQLKDITANIGPILIRGSILEAEGGKPDAN